MRSALFALALLLPSAAAAQPFAPCEPVDAQELLDCLNGRIARLETALATRSVLPAEAPAGGARDGRPLVELAPTLCAAWQRDVDGFRCTRFRRAAYRN